jgi:type I restriction-modification system DNA methylase subunit
MAMVGFPFPFFILYHMAIYTNHFTPSELWAKNQHLVSDKEKIELYTQKLLDRMIFMDVCYDKKIVGPDAHRAILYAQGSVYTELKKWFVKMDDHFNTDLFAPDDKIDNFVISNEVLTPIVEELSVIDFSILPVRIIGDVYEDYLGEMLRGGKKQGIQVQEDKERQKRKSQGIYYTPEYIVDYINENTIGELLKSAKKAEDIKKIKALDPACGSGSFLINAFDKFYQAYKKAGAVQKLGDFAVKKTILQHNLYGVDLDQRAVEICKLNLFLKALDGAKWEDLKGRKLLPNLELNIRCGNSLISGKSFAEKAKVESQMVFDFATPYTADRDLVELLKLRKKFYAAKEDHDKKELLTKILIYEEKVNSKLNDNLREYFSKPAEQKPLNFEVVFPEVFAQGGFDAVIGNPPWGQKGVKFTESVIKYFRQTYTSVQGIVDFFRPFVEKNSMVLKENGKYGLVLPDVLLLKNYPDTRKYILDNLSINNIDVWGMAFADVNLDSITITATKIKNTKNQVYIKVHDNNTNVIFENQIQQNDFLGNDGYKFNLYLSKKRRELLDKLCANSKYDALFETHEGIHSGNIREKLFISKPLNSNSKKLIFGRDEVQRYCITWDGKYVNYAKDIIDKNKGEYANLGHPHYFETPKIVIRRTGDHIVANIDKNGYYFSNNVFISLPKGKGVEAFEFILGVLNSRLITWYYRTVQPRKGKLFAEIKINVIEKIPIRRIDLKNNKDKAIHDQLVTLVKEMLALNKTPELREKNQIKIAAMDKQIDELVYKLYGLNEAEIKVVEGV